MNHMSPAGTGWFGVVVDMVCISIMVGWVVLLPLLIFIYVMSPFDKTKD